MVGRGNMKPEKNIISGMRHEKMNNASVNAKKAAPKYKMNHRKPSDVAANNKSNTKNLLSYSFKMK